MLAHKRHEYLEHKFQWIYFIGFKNGKNWKALHGHVIFKLQNTEKQQNKCSIAVTVSNLKNHKNSPKSHISKATSLASLHNAAVSNHNILSCIKSTTEIKRADLKMKTLVTKILFISEEYEEY